MRDDVIEAVARALWDKKSSAEYPWWNGDFDKCRLARELARAALAAIEARGLVVVPVSPTDKMLEAPSEMLAQSIEETYYAMLSARPKVTP